MTDVQILLALTRVVERVLAASAAIRGAADTVRGILEVNCGDLNFEPEVVAALEDLRWAMQRLDGILEVTKAKLEEEG